MTTTIALHIGAPETDREQLTWSLRKDAGTLLEQGVLVRRPGLYRSRLSRMLDRVGTEYITDIERAGLLDSILRGGPADRVFLSRSNTLGAPAWMLNGDCLFQNAGRNTGDLRDLFADHPCELFLGLRNPATLIPAVFGVQGERGWEAFGAGTDFLGLRWSEVVAEILEDCPDCPMTVWCHEETPLIWPEILRRAAGLGPDFAFSGELDMLGQLLSEEAIGELASALDAQPELSDEERRQLKARFVEEHMLEDVVEQEIDLPGWSQGMIDAMTETYLADLEQIRGMPYVTFLGL